MPSENQWGTGQGQPGAGLEVALVNSGCFHMVIKQNYRTKALPNSDIYAFYGPGFFKVYARLKLDNKIIILEFLLC
jgi:hypothetical protein